MSESVTSETDHAALGIDREAWPIAALSGLAVVLANASGLAISDDGVAYRAVADSLNERGVLGYFLEERLTTWPPLWPRAMALIDRISPLDAEGAAIALNVVSAVAAVLLFALAIRPLVERRSHRLAATVAFGLGSTQVLFGHILNTDFSMTIVFLALMVLMDRYRRKADIRWLMAAALVVWVGFGIRYAALAAIPIVAAWIPLGGESSFPTRVLHSGLFGVVAGAFPAGMMLANHAVDGTWLGRRSPSERGLAGNAFDAAAGVGNFVAPGVAIDARAIWSALAVATGLVAAAAGLRALNHAGALMSVRRARRALGSPLGLAVMWGLGFGAYLVLARTLTAFDRLNFRLIHPLWAPLIIVGLVTADRLLDRQVESDRRWRAVGATLLWGWVALSLVLGVVMAGWFATGPDLFAGNYEREAFAEVRESPLLDGLDDECVVHSNLPSALYPDMEAAWTPRHRIPESTEYLDELDELEASLPQDYCIAWIDLEPTFGNVATLDELSSRVRLVEQGSDGALTVYRVSPL